MAGLSAEPAGSAAVRSRSGLDYGYADNHRSGAFRFCRERYRTDYRQNHSSGAVLRPVLAALFLPALHIGTDGYPLSAAG
ncbi:hypothetical protein D3C79_819610 [compost metagenome]